MPNQRSRPKLSPKLIPIFKHFADLANRTGLHPYDWGRYYNFIANCHSLRSMLSEHDVKLLLIDAGFDDTHASYLADVYRHGRDIIKVHRGSVPHGATDRWANVGRPKGGQE